MTPSQIGIVLRDSYGIAQVKSVTGNKILRILKTASEFRPPARRVGVPEHAGSGQHCQSACSGMAVFARVTDADPLYLAYRPRP